MGSSPSKTSGQKANTRRVSATPGSSNDSNPALRSRNRRAISEGDLQEDVSAGQNQHPASNGTNTEAQKPQSHQGRPILPPIRLERIRFPPPRPPTKKKTEIFDPDAENIKVIDRHVRKFPRKLLIKPMQELVDYLLQKSSNDIQKVRALFTWLTSIDIRKVDFKSLPSEGTAADHLLKIKWKVNLHARLMAALCKIASIPCVVLTGMNKSAAYVLGEDVDRKRMEAYWNAVHLDGNWFLLDPFWASTIIRNPQTGNWKMMSTDGSYDGSSTTDGSDVNDHRTSSESATRNSEPQGGDWLHEPNEFYFLTDPQVLINTHFPDDQKWQLLAKPISCEDFENNLYLCDQFFQLGISTNENTPMHCVQNVNGTLLIEFNLPKEGANKYSFRYVYYKEYEDLTKSIRSASTDDMSTFIKFDHFNEKIRYQVSFPSTGTYKFFIFARNQDVDNDHRLMCAYLINCLSCS